MKTIKNLIHRSNSRSVQVVLGNFVDWLCAGSHVLHGDLVPGSAALYFEEAGVAVGHVVGPADRVVVGGADLRTAPKHEA